MIKIYYFPDNNDEEEPEQYDWNIYPLTLDLEFNGKQLIISDSFRGLREVASDDHIIEWPFEVPQEVYHRFIDAAFRTEK